MAEISKTPLKDVTPRVSHAYYQLPFGLFSTCGRTEQHRGAMHDEVVSKEAMVNIRIPMSNGEVHL
jgi:hypothetical protein